MTTIETLPQKIVDKKKIILKSRFDDNTIISYCDRYKSTFFPRHNLFKPNPKDIKLTNFIKYYESYLILGAKYSADFCKRQLYKINTQKNLNELYIGNAKFKTQTQKGKNGKIINIIGEEHSHAKKEAFFIVDRLMNEIPSDKLPFAPAEKIITEKIESIQDEETEEKSLRAEIEFLQSRIAQKPLDADVIRENFEITQRTVVCCPIYRLTYRNLRNNKESIVHVEGITGKISIRKPKKEHKINFIENSDSFRKEDSIIIDNSFITEKWQSKPKNNIQSYLNNNFSKIETKKIQEKNITPKFPVNQSASSSEIATTLAIAFLNNLGFQKSITPTRVYKEADKHIVELDFLNGTARVRVNINKDATTEPNFIIIFIY